MYIMPPASAQGGLSGSSLDLDELHSRRRNTL
jgi:hypothetical protein